MAKKTKTTLVALALALGSALLGWLQTQYGVDLGLCPPSHVEYVEPADAGAP